MSLQALTYFVVALSFALYIGIAIWSRAHSTGDFYIDGKQVTLDAQGLYLAAKLIFSGHWQPTLNLIGFLSKDRGQFYHSFQAHHPLID